MTREELKRLYVKGYRYLIEFEGRRIEPLAVKKMTDIGPLMRGQYPDEKNWRAVEFTSDGEFVAFQQRIATKFVQQVTVTDPDTMLPVTVEIRKMATGAMVGLDGSFLENCEDDAFSPYDANTFLDIPDDE